MIKNKYKLLVVILIIILLFNVCVNVSYANIIVEHDGITRELQDLPFDVSDENAHYVIAYKSSSNYYFLVFYIGDDFYRFECVPKNYVTTLNTDGAEIKDGSVKLSDYDITNDRWGEVRDWGSASLTGSIIVASSDPVYDRNTGEIYFEGTPALPSVQNPYIVNTADDLATSSFDYLLIMPGSFSLSDSFNFILRKCTSISADGMSYERQSIVYSTTLDWTSPFYYSVTSDFIVQEYWYEIPIEELGVTFSNDERYVYTLEKNGEVIQEIYVTIGGLTDEDKEANRLNTLITSTNKTTEAIKEQTEVIKENNETNKNIFQRIGEILSYINPFSENFFGKKLVELILDGLKSLFVPEDGFFQNYFDEIQQWFSDRLGFLWTPFDIIIEVLERILNISFDEPIIKIPDIAEPFTGQKLISQQEYNLNSLLENEILKNVHDIYFVCVDALIVFGLVNLTKKKIEEVFQN